MSNLINPDELWIGDELLLKKSNRVGFFQGIKNGKIRVKVDHSFILTPLSNIALPQNKKPNPALEAVSKELKLPSTKSKNLVAAKQSFNSTIDLHIEKLQPSKKNDPAFAIIEFQIRKLREFIEKAIALKCNKVTIIHGKGTGALKMETEHLVRSYDEYVSTYPINDGGGIIVYLNSK